MKQTSASLVYHMEGRSNVSDFVWETFDGLFKAVHQQDRRIKDLEARLAELERSATERLTQHRQAPPASERLTERAA